VTDGPTTAAAAAAGRDDNNDDGDGRDVIVTWHRYHQ